MPLDPEAETPALGTLVAPAHVMIAVAHSNKSKGVVVHKDGLDVYEYEISKRASIGLLRALSNDFRLTYDHHVVAGASRYLDAKVDAINALMPNIAVEIHCNAGPPSANYREVIYAQGSTRGKAAAEHVAKALTEAFPQLKPCKARANSVEMDKHLFYFLERTKVPALIVEGVFLTNPEHLECMQIEGGAESYGTAVARGLRAYLEGLNDDGSES